MILLSLFCAILQALLANGERMDIFVRLAADLNLRGYKVPLSSIHWVQAINRLLALSEKIGGQNLLSLKALLFSQRFGFSLQHYNAVRRPLSGLKQMAQPLFGSSHAAPVRCESIFGPM